MFCRLTCTDGLTSVESSKIVVIAMTAAIVEQTTHLRLSVKIISRLGPVTGALFNRQCADIA